MGTVYGDYLKAMQLKLLAGGAIQGAGNLAQGYLGEKEKQYQTEQEQLAMQNQQIYENLKQRREFAQRQQLANAEANARLAAEKRKEVFDYEKMGVEAGISPYITETTQGTIPTAPIQAELQKRTMGQLTGTGVMGERPLDTARLPIERPITTGGTALTEPMPIRPRTDIPETLNISSETKRPMTLEEIKTAIAKSRGQTKPEKLGTKEQEYQTLVRIYGEEKAKGMLATKYAGKTTKDERESRNAVEVWNTYSADAKKGILSQIQADPNIKSTNMTVETLDAYAKNNPTEFFRLFKLTKSESEDVDKKRISEGKLTEFEKAEMNDAFDIRDYVNRQMDAIATGVTTQYFSASPKLGSSIVEKLNEARDYMREGDWANTKKGLDDAMGLAKDDQAKAYLSAIYDLMGRGYNAGITIRKYYKGIPVKDTAQPKPETVTLNPDKLKKFKDAIAGKDDKTINDFIGASWKTGDTELQDIIREGYFTRAKALGLIQ